MKTKENKTNSEEPKFKLLHKSKELIAKNGNKYVVLVIEIQIGSQTQIQNIAFFL